jgi:hypothetical protein
MKNYTLFRKLEFTLGYIMCYAFFYFCLLMVFDLFLETLLANIIAGIFTAFPNLFTFRSLYLEWKKETVCDCERKYDQADFTKELRGE